MSHQKPWAESMTYIMQLPGFGVITAMTVQAAIGEIERFETPRKLGSYSGLTPGLEQSGTKNRGKGITKEGRRELRWALVEAAHVAANSHPYWKAELARLEPRLGRNKAIVAIERELLVTVWHVLQGKTDKYAEAEAVAQKMLRFAYAVGKANRPNGQTAAQFARIRMDALELGSELTSIPWGSKKPYPIATLEVKRKGATSQIVNSACGDLKRFCGLIAPKLLYNPCQRF